MYNIVPMYNIPSCFDILKKLYLKIDHIPILLGFVPFIVGKVKPKIMFVICQAISVLSIIAICVYSFLKEYGLLKEETLEKFSWIPLVFIGTLIILRGVGIMPVLHILINEMYPTDIRTLSIGKQNITRRE